MLKMEAVRRYSFLVGSLVVLAVSPAVSRAGAEGRTEAEAAPAGTTATAPAAISAADKAALDAAMDKEATVEGTVSDAQWSATGRVFLIKFEGAETIQFQGAILSKNREPLEKALGDLSAALEGARPVEGKVADLPRAPRDLD